jgi:hypothetical protein
MKNQIKISIKKLSPKTQQRLKNLKLALIIKLNLEEQQELSPNFRGFEEATTIISWVFSCGLK